jgi:hypothetical protein
MDAKHVVQYFIRENYTEWRTDQTVALQCHRCSAMFTIKHVGKANLIADYTKNNAVA